MGPSVLVLTLGMLIGSALCNPFQVNMQETNQFGAEFGEELGQAEVIKPIMNEIDDENVRKEFEDSFYPVPDAYTDLLDEEDFTNEVHDLSSNYSISLVEAENFVVDLQSNVEKLKLRVMKQHDAVDNDETTIMTISEENVLEEKTLDEHLESIVGDLEPMMYSAAETRDLLDEAMAELKAETDGDYDGDDMKVELFKLYQLVRQAIVDQENTMTFLMELIDADQSKIDGYNPDETSDDDSEDGDDYEYGDDENSVISLENAEDFMEEMDDTIQVLKEFPDIQTATDTYESLVKMWQRVMNTQNRLDEQIKRYPMDADIRPDLRDQFEEVLNTLSSQQQDLLQMMGNVEVNQIDDQENLDSDDQDETELQKLLELDDDEFEAAIQKLASTAGNLTDDELNEPDDLIDSDYGEEPTNDPKENEDAANKDDEYPVEPSYDDLLEGYYPGSEDADESTNTNGNGDSNGSDEDDNSKSTDEDDAESEEKDNEAIDYDNDLSLTEVNNALDDISSTINSTEILLQSLQNAKDMDESIVYFPNSNNLPDGSTEISVDDLEETIEEMIEDNLDSAENIQERVQEKLNFLENHDPDESEDDYVDDGSGSQPRYELIDLYSNAEYALTIKLESLDSLMEKLQTLRFSSSSGDNQNPIPTVDGAPEYGSEDPVDEEDLKDRKKATFTMDEGGARKYVDPESEAGEDYQYNLDDDQNQINTDKFYENNYSTEIVAITTTTPVTITTTTLPSEEEYDYQNDPDEQVLQKEQNLIEFLKNNYGSEYDSMTTTTAPTKDSTNEYYIENQDSDVPDLTEANDAENADSLKTDISDMDNLLDLNGVDSQEQVSQPKTDYESQFGAFLNQMSSNVNPKEGVHLQNPLNLFYPMNKPPSGMGQSDYNGEETTQEFNWLDQVESTTFSPDVVEEKATMYNYYESPEKYIDEDKAEEQEERKEEEAEEQEEKKEAEDEEFEEGNELPTTSSYFRMLKKVLPGLSLENEQETEEILKTILEESYDESEDESYDESDGESYDESKDKSLNEMNGETYDESFDEPKSGSYDINDFADIGKETDDSNPIPVQNEEDFLQRLKSVDDKDEKPQVTLETPKTESFNKSVLTPIMVVLAVLLGLTVLGLLFFRMYPKFVIAKRVPYQEMSIDDEVPKSPLQQHAAENVYAIQV